MKNGLVLSVLLWATAQAQNGPQPDLAGIDPDLIVNPPEGIDFEGCFADLVTADIDGSGSIEKDEYLNFINVYGERICWYQDELTLDQHGAFNSLACMCRSQEGNDASCCLLENAKLPNTGALTPGTRTEEELLFMTVACIVTDGTLEHLCTPYVLERNTPPPVIIVPVGNDLRGLDTDLPDGSIWALIMGIIGLLLLVCLFCCCLAAGTKSRRKDEEEEEEDIQVIPPVDKEPPMEQAPRGGFDLEEVIEETMVIPPVAEEEEEEEEEEEIPEEPQEEVEEEEEEITEELEDGAGAGKRGGVEIEDPDDGDGRRGRGFNYADEEPEDTQRRWGGPRLPPPEDSDPDPLKLKPIPPKDPEEPPEWDQPGREILEARNKDEMEGQVFEPYDPGGGVHDPKRPVKDPLDWRKDWNRPKPPEVDEDDNRKHRIQSGLGEGEVFDRLNDNDSQSKSLVSGGGDIFDWVVQSALGVLDKADEVSEEAEDDDSSTVNA
jgi:hypothetical protein